MRAADFSDIYDETKRLIHQEVNLAIICASSTTLHNQAALSEHPFCRDISPCRLTLNSIDPLFREIWTHLRALRRSLDGVVTEAVIFHRVVPER